jgi:toxin YoeB
MPGQEKRIVVVSTHFQEDLRRWIETDRKVALRVLDLMAAILDDPFSGIGKPEAAVRICRLLEPQDYS